MWIFLPDSFLSVVADRNDPGRLLVRARFQGDIERVFPEAAVIETGPSEADYRFRAFIERGRVVEVLAAQVGAIDYPNFKGEVSPVDKLRGRTYMRVWSVMNDSQRTEREYGHADLLDRG